jgi:hypothetical protein
MMNHWIFWAQLLECLRCAADVVRSEIEIFEKAILNLQPDEFVDYRPFEPWVLALLPFQPELHTSPLGVYSSINQAAITSTAVLCRDK